MKDTYPEYLEKLSSTSGVEINDLESFKKAVENRLDFFVEMGCKVTDTGLVYFPNYVATDKKADKTFEKILKREKVTEEEYIGFIGNMYLFLGKLYKERNLVMQWHLASDRNINTKLYKLLGLDCGVDCVGNAVDGPSLFKMLDAINENSGLPKTIVYTLNPSNAEQIGTITSAFPNVCCGAAWWFCDHRRGIEHEIQVICENSSLGSFYGMLTDSRSFLSYARHDYFRRILCNMVGKWVENGEYDAEQYNKRNTVSLNGFWQFCTDEQSKGEKEKWFLNFPEKGEKMYVPSCFNNSFGLLEYKGILNEYRKPKAAYFAVKKMYENINNEKTR